MQFPSPVNVKAVFMELVMTVNSSFCGRGSDEIQTIIDWSKYSTGIRDYGRKELSASFSGRTAVNLSIFKNPPPCIGEVGRILNVCYVIVVVYIYSRNSNIVAGIAYIEKYSFHDVTTVAGLKRRPLLSIDEPSVRSITKSADR